MAKSSHFGISREQLLIDLYKAYRDARKHKRRKKYQLAFESNLEKELIHLCNSIYDRSYRPDSSSCFIIHDPKMREVFAAQFRDRIVHHLLYNYIAPLLEPSFIEDSYSCIKGRGTHYGIKRLEEKIREISCNYSCPCYILKLDIEGYFMHINRNRLLEICLCELAPFSYNSVFPLIKFLLEVTILDKPENHCYRIGPVSEWQKLPPGKSLFCSPDGCGLPIGNLTSQLFSNIYLNVFDQKMLSLLGSGRYGRYVDDAYIVGNNPAELRRIVPIASKVLQEELGLKLNNNKIAIYSAYRGVEFLGAYLKPFRSYMSNHTLSRIDGKFRDLPNYSKERLFHCINSYLGLTSHYRAYSIRKKWIDGPLAFAFKDGYFGSKLLKYRLNRNS